MTASARDEGAVDIQITLPIPPATLSKNGRAHWAQRNRDFQTAKDNAYAALCEELGALQVGAVGRLVMDAIWRYSNASHVPDADNMLSRLSPAMDAAQFIGLVEDDIQISIGKLTTARCKPGRERVMIRFRREDGTA